MAKKITISVISKSCGLPAQTLRAWETRYQAFSPRRDDDGNRIYSANDLERATLLSSLTINGHRISNISGLKVDQLKELLDNYSSESLNRNISKSLLKHIENYDINLMTEEISHIRLNCGVKEFLLETVLPVMREIGTLVEKGKYSITQEHIISSIITDQLSQIQVPQNSIKINDILFATPEGNIHELSIQIANILAKVNRVNTKYFGAAHPYNCLAEAINTIKPSIIVLGVISSDVWNYEKEIIPYLSGLDNSLTKLITVILGGGKKINLPKFKKIEEVLFMSSFSDFDKYLEKLP